MGSKKYDEFKTERSKPFDDLVSHIVVEPNLKIIDLGCGTGELTKRLYDKLSNSSVLGIDNSAEMLAKAPTAKNLTLES